MSDLPKHMNTPKQKVVQQMDKPFEEVPKDNIKSPMRRKDSRKCEHTKANKSSAYPTSGPTWVCCDCHRVTSYPEDLE